MKALTIFSAAQLTKLVNDTMPKDAQPGDHITVLTVDQAGAQIAASFKLKADKVTWDLQAAARHDWTGENSVGAKILLRW